MTKASMNNYISKNLPGKLISDLISGIIVALVSIPISMGYSEIAGLPAVYGLYGSLLPILIFGLLSTTRDFVFGVDAAPAALTGGALISLGIGLGTEEAKRMVPLLTLMVSAFIFIFFLLNAARAVKYISTPVMGGFITGICLEIITMQLPKLFGGKPGTGELPELIVHICEETSGFSKTSFILGISTIAVLLISRRLIPKVPMSIVVMLIGAFLSMKMDFAGMGIKLLPEVDPGLPVIQLPEFNLTVSNITDLVFDALVIAIVITAETLLASQQNALNDGYRLDNRRETLCYCLANLAASLTGCCPVNASVSRTTIVRQFGCKSQLMSVFASASMCIILCFCTGFIKYLPIPLLTGIVVSALLSACEFHLAKRLAKESRVDFYIFISAMLGVLLFGTIYGVIIGVILSFTAVIIKAVAPPRSMMGIIPGHDSFYSLARNRNARPVDGAVIYRFSGNLFFGNIDIFENDIEKAIDENTRCVIVYASGIGDIDITAADRLLILRKSLSERGILFFLTEHEGKLNDKLRAFGADELIKTGAVRMTVDTALRVAGIHKPYPMGGEDRSVNDEDELLTGISAELEWAFGNESEEMKERIAAAVLKRIFEEKDITSLDELVSAEKTTSWGRLAYFDEDEILERIEDHLHEIDEEKAHVNKTHIEEMIEKRRRVIEAHIRNSEISSLKKLQERRHHHTEMPDENKK